MQKLRNAIEQYSRWKGLEIYVDRMEAHLESDFSHSLENAKALLESIGKEICDAKRVELSVSSSTNAVLKQAFSSLGYTGDELVSSVSGSLANIGRQLGSLRNDISPTSHGRSLRDLEARNDQIDALTRDFLIDSTVVVAVFLIRAFEERIIGAGTGVGSTTQENLDYSENEDFNSFWDDLFGEFAMGQYSYTSSEILFNVDSQAYSAERIAFKESEGSETEDIA